MRSSVMFSALLILLTVFSCTQAVNNAGMQNRIDSLEHKLANTYKPGLGEFMSGIQIHHSKLWFAGLAGNWKLAGFEVAELRESFDAIKEYCADRPETNSIGTIAPAMDSISDAIQEKNSTRFNSSYNLLTNTCNNCHRATQHEFNVIRIPDSPPFSNQDFKLH